MHHSQHLSLHACHRSSSYHFSCSWCRGRMLRLANVKEQNHAQMVALVLLCQSLTALETSWRAMPGVFVGTLRETFLKRCF